MTISTTILFNERRENKNLKKHSFVFRVNLPHTRHEWWKRTIDISHSVSAINLAHMLAKTYRLTLKCMTGRRRVGGEGGDEARWRKLERVGGWGGSGGGGGGLSRVRVRPVRVPFVAILVPMLVLAGVVFVAMVSFVGRGVPVVDPVEVVAFGAVESARLQPNGNM